MKGKFPLSKTKLYDHAYSFICTALQRRIPRSTSPQRRTPPAAAVKDHFTFNRVDHTVPVLDDIL